MDANGNEHVYRAANGQYYTLYIPNAILPNGNTVTMVRQAGGFLPATYANSTSTDPNVGNIGQFQLIGANMQKTAIFMAEVPELNHEGSSYMTRPKGDWTFDEIGPMVNPVTLGISNESVDNTDLYDVAISGKVWLETGDGNRSSGTIIGPTQSRNEPNARGYYVGISWLTPEGRQAYEQQVRGLDQALQSTAATELLTANPQYIEGTRLAQTDEEGRYTIRFQEEENIESRLPRNIDYIYMFVLNSDMQPVIAYNSYTVPVFRAPNKNSAWTPRPNPALGTQGSIYNVNHAVIPDLRLGLEVTSHDTINSPARLGDVVEVDIIGTQLPPAEFDNRLEWVNESGEVLKTTPVTTFRPGTDDTWTVPSTPESAKALGIKPGEIINVRFISGTGDIIAADSFIIQYDDLEQENQIDAIENNPVYLPIEVKQGNSITLSGPLNEDGSALPDGTTFKPTPDEEVPGWATVNPNGTIDLEPGLNLAPGNYEIPVEVNYPDGSKETIYASVEVVPRTVVDANGVVPVAPTDEAPTYRNCSQQSRREHPSDCGR